jgi:NAD(P)H-dependent FMN reductase
VDAALVGSLRAGSYNRQLAEAAAKYAPDDVDVDIFDDLADVAFYNEDIDRPGTVAADWLRVEVQTAEALLLVTPEYNGTIPATLKNTIDWISRPYGAGAISGKPLAVIGVSNGRYGGVWAHDDTRKAASIAGASVLDDVTLSVPHGTTRFATIHPHTTTRSPTRCRSSWPLSPPRSPTVDRLSRSHDHKPSGLAANGLRRSRPINRNSRQGQRGPAVGHRGRATPTDKWLRMGGKPTTSPPLSYQRLPYRKPGQTSKRDLNRSRPTVMLLAWVYSWMASPPWSRPIPLIL